MPRAVKLWILLIFPLLILMPGCGNEPDLSAPERIEVERSADWHGALLYIADRSGPAADRGSIRVYDNVSGFVEKTIEQVSAAEPSEAFVTPDGSSMYAASFANGLIDRFRWDGNAWIRGSFDIETPATSLLTLKAGPDGRLYSIDGSAGFQSARVYALDPATDRLAPDAIDIPALRSASGISWSLDGSRAYVAGISSASQTPVLLEIDWPAGTVIRSIEMPLAQSGKVVTAPDGRFVYVTGRGQILKMESATGAIAGYLNPGLNAAIDYSDADFSADGRFIFIAGTQPGNDSTLFVVDLESGALVNTVEHISKRADGLQRVE